MASPILLFPFQEYWSQLREGTRDQIVGGIIVLIVGAVGGAVWKRLRRRSIENVDPQPASVQPTPQEVVVKIEGAQPVPAKEIPPEPIISKRSPIPRPPLAGFVARRDENGRDIVERLKEELLPEKEQLIVLWGAGGVGKTTLAAETARAMREVFTDGIVWTTADGKPDFTLSTLLDEAATQLGRPDLRQLAPGPKEEAVHQLLSTTSATLIVLDNFETISPSEQERCANWLANRASCSALITSRDQVLPARPVRILAMSLAEAREFLQRLISELGNNQAFVDLDPEQIIQAAGRIPLVLQWVVRQIDSARQPQTVLDELSHGEGDAAKRVFDRSFDLPQLGDDGRATLLALSLFVPSASRPALAEVAGFENDLGRLDRAVQQLVELWLIQPTAGNERLRVEGLTRELAKARVTRDANADYRRRFVGYFREFAREHDQESPEDYTALEAERDNLLNSIDLAFELAEWDSVQSTVLAIAQPVGGWLTVCGYWTEALSVNQRALDAAQLSDNKRRAAVFGNALGVLYANRGELDQARTLFIDSLRVFKELGDEAGTAAALHQMGRLADSVGDVVEARRLYSESLEIDRKRGDEEGIAVSLHELARLAQSEGEFVEAGRLYKESLEIKKRRGNVRGVSATLHQMGLLAHRQGELDKARELFNESLEIKRRLGNQFGIAVTLGGLGRLAEDEGKRDEAEHMYQEAFDIFDRLKSPMAKIAREDLRRVGVNRSS